MPSAIRANALMTIAHTRTPTSPVAIEHENGCTGTPATQFSRTSTSKHRKLPAFNGIGGASPRLEFNTMRIGATPLLREVASVRLKPFGMQSGLSRRSTVT